MYSGASETAKFPVTPSRCLTSMTLARSLTNFSFSFVISVRNLTFLPESFQSTISRFEASTPITTDGPFESEQTSIFSRSEEHTSELQSQSNLVCRLLLEKKKNNLHTSNLYVIGDDNDISHSRLTILLTDALFDTLPTRILLHFHRFKPPNLPRKYLDSAH